MTSRWQQRPPSLPPSSDCRVEQDEAEADAEAGGRQQAACLHPEAKSTDPKRTWARSCSSAVASWGGRRRSAVRSWAPCWTEASSPSITSGRGKQVPGPISPCRGRRSKSSSSSCSTSRRTRRKWKVSFSHRATDPRLAQRAVGCSPLSTVGRPAKRLRSSHVELPGSRRGDANGANVERRGARRHSRHRDVRRERK